jgi:hypothetical protein
MASVLLAWCISPVAGFDSFVTRLELGNRSWSAQGLSRCQGLRVLPMGRVLRATGATNKPERLF